jgi:hypothetical protein
LFCLPGDHRIDPKKYTMAEVAKRAQEFFKAEYEKIDPKPENHHPFEYWIGGYGSDSDLHEVWTFKIENGELLPATLCGAPGDPVLIYGGQIEAVSRLVEGYSPLMTGALAKAGLGAEAAKTLLEKVQEVSPRMRASLVNAAMPIPDAIELADFLADTTKRFVRFLPGADTVGGEIDIATVTRHERFKWIRRKHYYPTQLNPLETDHV